MVVAVSGGVVMIVTRKKPFDEIVSAIGSRCVLLVGCAECAAVCRTGGEPEVVEMKQKLEGVGISVRDWVVLDPACDRRKSRLKLKKRSELLDSEGCCVVVLSCGDGVQTVAGVVPKGVEVIGGLESMFVGEQVSLGVFERRCVGCNECVVDRFVGFCPVSRCPKGMLNGPCGGVGADGSCEVSPEISCVWLEVVEKLKSLGRLDELDAICPARDWSKSLVMRWEVGSDE